MTYLEQLYTFGNPDRDPRNHAISVSYFGLMSPRGLQPVAQTDAEEAAWFNIKKIPRLAFDHRRIIDVAVKRLRGKLTYEPVGFELLDKSFPFSDLEKLYPLSRHFGQRSNHCYSASVTKKRQAGSSA